MDTKFEDLEKNPTALWRFLLDKQTGMVQYDWYSVPKPSMPPALVEATIAENERLTAENRDLQREVQVWKQALSRADADQEEVQKAAGGLEQQLSELTLQLCALRDDNPLVLILIDGDGNIFSEDLLRQGANGGRNAAALLTKGVQDSLVEIDPRISSRARLWAHIYCNKAGLSETMCTSNICTAEQFENFCLGFNQAAPMFSIIDVGHGKEAADTKIKEFLRVFAHYPQTAYIYFGGGHDNGYYASLTSLETQGLSHKIVLLHGYKELAFELKNIKLNACDIDGLFRETKVPSKHKAKQRSVSDRSETPNSGKVALGLTELRPDQNITKCKPAACTFYYLGNCAKGVSCKFAHHYVLLPIHREQLKRHSKTFPCVAMNKGNYCPAGENCISAHVCPFGRNCKYFKEGKCRFVGADMHSKPKKTNSTLGVGNAPYTPTSAPFLPYSDGEVLATRSKQLIPALISTSLDTLTMESSSRTGSSAKQHSRRRSTATASSQPPEKHAKTSARKVPPMSSKNVDPPTASSSRAASTKSHRKTQSVPKLPQSVSDKEKRKKRDRKMEEFRGTLDGFEQSMKGIVKNAVSVAATAAREDSSRLYTVLMTELSLANNERLNALDESSALASRLEASQEAVSELLHEVDVARKERDEALQRADALAQRMFLISQCEEDEEEQQFFLWWECRSRERHSAFGSRRHWLFASALPTCFTSLIMALSEYEKQRNTNIARNRALLENLGLDKPMFEPIEPQRKKPSAKKPVEKKRKAEASEDEPVAKAQRVEGAENDDPNASTVRRSSRNRGKTVDYNSEKTTSALELVAYKTTPAPSGNTGPVGDGKAKRIYSFKRYGSIPGIEVGTWWASREDCSNDAIHAPWVGGISGGPKGAYSVALSGGYDDDVDLGYVFTYTGAGGRDLRGTKANRKNLRTAPQSCDQKWESVNLALQTSVKTRNPVRVIRGFKVPSPYAPTLGYRYDGLYEVQKAWMEKGINKGGHKVCKFAFKRLPNQPPLPRRDTNGQTGEKPSANADAETEEAHVAEGEDGLVDDEDGFVEDDGEGSAENEND
ncbi:hypothetical protein CYLTODRAFT_441129 [Cylindrobasidium torrendii FP15055 ss-10]|uniref:YDG domain-containing protein n=1 Tax=Cylindrobasidium torrendii FP15055 ss-10 TaxID=1314674 RepID=A0A0D7BM98_9AGAR|nr:hypothetical protein CYLTODRAFT_441129 [Cylindrobasidium torrendii FP15055 ss-10]